MAGTVVGLAACCSTSAFAYIGDSFIRIDAARGVWRGKDHKGWIRVEGHQWVGRMPRGISGLSDPLAGDKLFFGGPNVVPPGNPGQIVIVLGKNNPDLPQLMKRCADKVALPEITYAESSDLARPGMERGARPAEFPAFWEYRLKGVRIIDCPVLAGAEQQALVVNFDNIEWLNYDARKSIATKVVVKRDDLPAVAPVMPSPRQKTRSYLVTWAGPATDTTDEQCPVMNARPTEAEILKYLAPEEAAELRAKAGKAGIGPSIDSQRRGPHRLDVGALPGIIPDPGLREPVTQVAMGLDLDGDDGRGAAPAGVRKHVNFVSADGRTGIDNELLRVMGCIQGFRGKRGYLNQTPNARRADGNIVTIVEVSGIDDETNDDAVEVSIIHSGDKPMRDNGGKTFIPNYTYRPTEDPNFALYNVRLKGRIVNGAVITDVVPRFQYNPGQGGITDFYKARLRIDSLADGSARVTLGGYLDWKSMAGGSGYAEGLANYNSPGVYYALKRHADGLKNPLTGEFDGISAAYVMDTVPAFITGAEPSAIAAAHEDAAPLPVAALADAGRAPRYSTASTTLDVVYRNPALRAVLAQQAPDVLKRTDLTQMGMAMTLRELKYYWRVYPNPPDLSDPVLARIDAEFAKVEPGSLSRL